MSGWNNPLTAKKYDGYAQTYISYKNTNRDLVKIADISADQLVVDLACGTGMTSQAILQKLSPSGHIFAVDSSPAMLQVAKQNIEKPNVSFHISPAERVHEVVPGQVDRILCNSAFWQMETEATLASIRRLLKDEGLFAFNLPDILSPICKQPGGSVDLRTLMRQVAAEEYGWEFDPAPATNRSRLHGMSYENIPGLLAEHGYELAHHERVVYQETYEAAREFCAIPVMTENTIPGADYETRLEILGKAYGRLAGAEQLYESAWDYYVVALKQHEGS